MAIPMASWFNLTSDETYDAWSYYTIRAKVSYYTLQVTKNKYLLVEICLYESLLVKRECDLKENS